MPVFHPLTFIGEAQKAPLKDWELGLFPLRPASRLTLVPHFRL